MGKNRGCLNKAKSKKPKDFDKVTTKVGKKKKDAANSTDRAAENYTAKKIVMPAQLQAK